MERGDDHSRRRTCPGCSAPTVTLPLFTSRRRTPVTCTHCGAKLERVLPAPSYYTLAFIIGILVEPAALVLLLLVIVQQWLWFAALLTGLVLLNLGASAFLNSRTRVEFVEPRDARKDTPGRWYPKDPGD